MCQVDPADYFFLFFFLIQKLDFIDRIMEIEKSAKDTLQRLTMKILRDKNKKYMKVKKKNQTNKHIIF